MMKKLISIFSIILFLASCDDLQTVIDIDLPPHESKLVINSSNQFGKPFRAYISHSIDPLSNDNFEFYSNASVTLFENDMLIDTLSFIDSSYFYQSNVSVDINKTYAIEVNHPSHLLIKSKNISAPDPVEISTASNLTSSSADGVNSLEFSFNDPIGPNYYLLKLKAFFSYENFDGQIQSDSYGLGFDSSDPSISNGSFEFDDEFSAKKVLFDDVLFNGETKRLQLEYISFGYYDDVVREGSKIDSISIILCSVDYDFYQYHKTRIQQKQTGGGAIFGTEPVNVYNSFDNDYGSIPAYGLFSIISKDTLVLKP